MAYLRASAAIDYGAGEEEVRALEDLFRDIDVELEVTPGVMQFTEVPPWVFALAIELNPFLARLQQLAAEDAYLTLKRFVGRVRDARRLSGRPDGVVELEDRESGVRPAALDPDMPRRRLPRAIRAKPNESSSRRPSRLERIALRVGLS